jgi:cell division protein FtsQ
VLLAGIGVLAVGAGAYLAAVDTSLFAVRRLVIVGGTPRVQAELRRALAPEVGQSLVRVGKADIDDRIASLADVIGVRYDRQFPHTLRVSVSAERPVLLLRRGSDTWLVSARARVMRQIGNPHLSSLPRVWVPKGTNVAVGRILPPAAGGAAATAIAPLLGTRFPSGLRLVRADGSELTLVLRSGLQVRLGDLGDLRLKLAIARRILHTVHADSSSTGYLDVSVPERPVIEGTNAQVSTGGLG